MLKNAIFYIFIKFYIYLYYDLNNVKIKKKALDKYK